MTNKANIFLMKVPEPPLNEVVYVRKKWAIAPCIVLSGQLWENGRLSNFWHWIDLVTKKEEAGYGDFYVLKTINEESENGTTN